MPNVLVDENSLQSIANAIREKNGTDTTYKPAEMSQAILDMKGGDYDQGYEDGKNSVVNPLEYAQSIAEGYKNVAFPEGYELNLNLPNATSLYRSFQEANGIEKVVIKGNNNGNIINFESVFRSCRTIKTLDLTEFNAKIGSAYMTFYYAVELYEVLGQLDFTECSSATYAFNACSNLVTLTPKANSIKISIDFSGCTKLSTTSKQSIFDGLAVVDTAQTLTLHANLKILQTQVDSANAKGWTVAGGIVVSEEEYYAE